MSLRPFFSYFGSKWTLAPQYPAPEHSIIVEPFAGSAGYATRYADREVVLVEKFPLLAALWRWLVRVSVDEVLSLPLDPTRLDNVAPEARTHWRVIEGNYTEAPDVEATWFIDPPYLGSRDYLARVDDFGALGSWCRARRGLVVVCEQAGADWLPFVPFSRAKSMRRRSCTEVVHVERRAA